MQATGRCLCGAVTFTAEDVDTDYHACHCGMCQRWCGGPAFGVMVGTVRFAGLDAIARYRSSDFAERGFCRECGSHLFFHVTADDQYALWVGAFDDPAPFRLAGEIYCDDKPAGYAFAGDHPRLTGEEFIASLQGSEE